MPDYSTLMKKCPGCGAAAPAADRHCTGCGRPFPVVPEPEVAARHEAPPPPAAFGISGQTLVRRSQDVSTAFPPGAAPIGGPWAPAAGPAFQVPSDSRMIYKMPGRHRPAKAVACNLLVVGLGQMVNGQGAKGAAMLAVWIAIRLLTLNSGPIMLVPLLAMGLLSMYDAGAIAARLNRGEGVGKWQWF
jgi:TM2 domain-containing membrane protein YozV